MKILLSWLREFVDSPVDAPALARDLTMAGISVESVEQVGSETVFTMEITTNRPDAMNHYGVAREAAALYDRELEPLEAKLPRTKGEAKFKIEIEDAQGCARYTARIVRGIKVGQSPKRVAERLELNDARPINSAADATNYNLIEMGHPTHAFDLDLLEGGKIVVRRARAGEKLKTLDGVERALTPDDLVIADAKKPVALAGVMGGFGTMITEKTKNVLVESAWFDPVVIRRMARRHGMHTDASHRFERGADWGATPLACARVAQLILESSGGELEGGEIDAIARQVERPELRLRRSEVLRHLGQDIPEQDISRILRRLGFGVTPGRAAQAAPLNPGTPRTTGGARAAIAEQVADWSVTVPTWRLDVAQEIDLIEELARIYGYNNFANTLPGFSGAVVELPTAEKEARVRRTLLALGCHEAMSYSFIAHADARAFSSAVAVELANPLNEELSVLRTSLVPGMLDMLAHNLNRGAVDVRLFEAGHIFEALGAGVSETSALCLGATGSAAEASVHQPARPYSFFDLKGDLETLLAAFEHKALYFDAHASEYYHPGRAARAVLDGETVARFGQLHPDIAARRKLKQEVYLAEVALERLFQRALREPRYERVSRFPAVERDFSLLFADEVTFDRIRSAVEALRIAELRRFTPVEIFRGGAVPAGKHSVLLRATFQSRERTLRDDEVAGWAQQVIQALKALGGTLRA